MVYVLLYCFINRLLMLPLLLVDPTKQMKGEGVEPGSVVYTAALAECRWAGQTRHVDYLRQQMEAEGMTIVPGLGPHDLELHRSHVCGTNYLELVLGYFLRQ